MAGVLRLLEQAERSGWPPDIAAHVRTSPVLDAWSAMPPLLPCLRSCCAPPPAVAIVATTFERAKWIASWRGWTRSRWYFVTEPRHLGGAVHVVLDELPDGPMGDLIWEHLLLLKHFTGATVEGVIG